jgi:hypothetical protein
MTGRTILATMLTVAAACAVAAEPDPQDDYSSDLSRVYWGYHQVLTQKEVCDTASPATRAANAAAFTAWQAQHKALVEDLRRRVTAMIRLASSDEKDYTRNLGKYEGAILQERQEYRDSLLKLDAKELRGQCQRMAAVLKSPEADLNKVYSVELEAIHKRK